MIEQTEQLSLKNEVHKISHRLICSRIRTNSQNGTDKKLAILLRNGHYVTVHYEFTFV